MDNELCYAFMARALPATDESGELNTGLENMETKI